VDLAGWEKP
jgi:ubiquitin carboxyl-terminal hydrolase 34